MKRRLMTIALFVWVAMFVMVGGVSAQEEAEATPLEIEEAQATARRFVSRMLQTRDVAALFNELFLPDFTSHFVSDEFVPPSLYAHLNRTERQRLFVVMYNVAYLSAVALMSDHEDMKVVYGEAQSNTQTLLPRSTLMKLKRAVHLLGDENNRATSYRQLRVFLSAMENALAETRTSLAALDIEKTREFQRRLAPQNGLGSGIDYRVRAYIGGQNVKDCEPLIGFPQQQKFFRVELPLLIAAILVKDGRQMKIVRLTFADGD